MIALPTPTIFHEPWWLETACEGHPTETIVEQGGTVLGRLPYLKQSARLCGTSVVMPPLTHVLGPALSPDIADRDGARVHRRFSVLSELIARLPPASRVEFRLHPGLRDTMAFQAAGFTTTVDFTLHIAPAPEDELWRRMRDKTRNVIRRADERLTVGCEAGASGFLDFYDDNLTERHRRNMYDRGVFAGLIREAVARDTGRILFARDGNGAPQAAIFTVWDHRFEYYFASTRRDGSPNGAASLLIWHAIRHASARGLTFDMDGVSESNRLLVTGFGGQMLPRFFVARHSAGRQIARLAKSGLKHLLGRPATFS